MIINFLVIIIGMGLLLKAIELIWGKGIAATVSLVLIITTVIVINSSTGITKSPFTKNIVTPTNIVNQLEDIFLQLDKL